MLSLFSNSSVPAFCVNETTEVNNVSESMGRMKLIFYSYATMPVLAVGIIGNVLNLITLRARTLQSVPFMYIRAVAVCDLFGLILIVPMAARIGGFMPLKSYVFAWYQNHAEITLVNTFLAASMYCAIALTVERYLMICRPTRSLHHKNHRLMGRINISAVCILSLVLHLPITFEARVEVMDDGSIKRVDNKQLFCVPIWKAIYTSYRFFRELIRFTGVLLLAVLNFVIILELRKANRRKRQLQPHKSSSHNGSRLLSTGSINENAVIRSFTENKVSVLMVVIAVLYIIGNMPMIFVHLFHLETSDVASNYNYQLFRAIANLCEVLLHCLNFYMFCLASSDYCEAFFTNCVPKWALRCRKGDRQADRSRNGPIDKFRRNLRRKLIEGITEVNGTEMENSHGTQLSNLSSTRTPTKHSVQVDLIHACMSTPDMHNSNPLINNLRINETPSYRSAISANSLNHPSSRKSSRSGANTTVSWSTSKTLHTMVHKPFKRSRTADTIVIDSSTVRSTSLKNHHVSVKHDDDDDRHMRIINQRLQSARTSQSNKQSNRANMATPELLTPEHDELVYL